jgi:hypothetical protein
MRRVCDPSPDESIPTFPLQQGEGAGYINPFRPYERRSNGRAQRKRFIFPDRFFVTDRRRPLHSDLTVFFVHQLYVFIRV